MKSKPKSADSRKRARRRSCSRPRSLPARKVIERIQQLEDAAWRKRLDKLGAFFDRGKVHDFYFETLRDLRWWCIRLQEEAPDDKLSHGPATNPKP